MRRLLARALGWALPVAALLTAAPARAVSIDSVIAYGDSLWDEGVTGASCDSCAAYPPGWNVREYAVAGTKAWHQFPCDGAEWPGPDPGCENGEDVALRRAGYCPAAGNARFPALTPCLEDNADADVVVVQFGSNDVRAPDDRDTVWNPWDEGDGTPTVFLLLEHLEGLRAILDQVETQQQACVLVTPPPIWSDEGGTNPYPTAYETANARLDGLRTLHLAEARAHGCVHVDLYQTFLDYEADYGEAAMLALYLWCPAKGVTQGPGGDCVHLSAAGNAVLGAAVRDGIEAAASPSAFACGNGVDDDGDGLVDLDDPGCAQIADADERSPTLACDDGADNDGDGGVDLADAGCAGVADTDERSAALPCDDGVDNDGDGKIDYRAAGGGDPGCYDPRSPVESPPCQDGINNDNQFGMDHDGGLSLDLDRNGFVDARFNPATPKLDAPDPQCVGKPWGDTEGSGGCGLGLELALLAPLLAQLARARRA